MADQLLCPNASSSCVAAGRNVSAEHVHDGKKPVAMLCGKRFGEDAIGRFSEEMDLLQPELIERVDYLAASPRIVSTL